VQNTKIAKSRQQNRIYSFLLIRVGNHELPVLNIHEYASPVEENAPILIYLTSEGQIDERSQVINKNAKTKQTNSMV
jgi:hypothetical protein